MPRPLLNDVRGNTAGTLIVLGSGGHTAEMPALVKHLDKDKLQPRTYVVASTDRMGAQKAWAAEQEFQASKGGWAVLLDFDLDHPAGSLGCSCNHLQRGSTTGHCEWTWHLYTSVLCCTSIQIAWAAHMDCVCGEHCQGGVIIIVWQDLVSFPHSRCILCAVATPTAEVSQEHMPGKLVLVLTAESLHTLQRSR